jgi:hypothetical protein
LSNDDDDDADDADDDAAACVRCAMRNACAMGPRASNGGRGTLYALPGDTSVVSGGARSHSGASSIGASASSGCSVTPSLAASVSTSAAAVAVVDINDDDDDDDVDDDQVAIGDRRANVDADDDDSDAEEASARRCDNAAASRRGATARARTEAWPSIIALLCSARREACVYA